ncbi:MAG: GDSL-type esterase/lipase family protein, partial [Eubacteriales bacterium]|nr:GDSL-type esterase/lipase family protein [Eubacteriales bacterium]
DVSGNDVSGNDVSGNHAAGTEGGASAGEQSGDGGSAQNPEDAGAAGSGGSGEEDAQLSEEEKAKRENETYVHADSMPEGVNNEVVGAVDYGNADQRFLSPEGTAYNEDTAGLFAQNGDYYRFRSVDEVYFSDAIFIGDSRTVGLYDYGGLQGKTTFLAKESISVYNMYERKLDLYEPGAQTQSKTVLEALMTKQYRKVYLSVGVNELGIPDTKEYYQKYREAVAVIRQLQPDAIIYIEGIMHVTEKKSKSDSVFNNTNIVQRNNAIATLANGHDIFYIDMNTAVCDEDGNLRSDLTADGVHLKGSAYALWYDFLLQNAIVRDGNDYLGTGPTEGGVDLSSLQTAQ